MPAKKTTALAKSEPKSNLPVNYAAQLAKEAAEISKRVSAPTGDRIRIRGNSGFATPDGNEGTEISAIILDFVSANLYYDRPFTEGEPIPPACFAIGTDPTTLVPSSNSPVEQCKACTGCPQNQFGSALVGKGKACKNTRLLAMLPEDAEDSSPIWIMSIPPTSIKAWDAYVSMLAAKHKTSPIAMVTKITPDTSVTYAAPRFEVSRVLAANEIGAYFERRQEAMKRLLSEPDVTQYEPPPVRGARGVVKPKK